MPVTPLAIRGPGRTPSTRAPTRATRLAVQPQIQWQPPNPNTATTISYVRKTGSDANGGTSPADAWLTINHALATAAPGTAVYVGAGTYRETLTVAVTPTGQAPLWIIGDVDGVYTGDIGMVQFTGYTTNDTTTPSATVMLNFNGKSWFFFRNIMFMGGNATMLSSATTSQYVAFHDCSFFAGIDGTNRLVNQVSTYGVTLHWLFDRCIFMAGSIGGNLTFTVATGVGGDFDVDVQFNNSVFLQATAGANQMIRFAPSGAAAGHPGGLKIRNCTFIGSTFVGAITGTSVNIPCSVTGSFIYAGTALTNTTQGMIVEDYNQIATATVGSISQGSHSVWNINAPLFHMGQERNWGGQLRPFGEPMVGSPLLAFGSPDTLAGLLDNRQGPRQMPASQWAAGAFQRGQTFAESTAISEDSDGFSIAVTGPGFHDFDIPLDSGSATVSVWVQYDSNYTGPLPELVILPNGEMGLGSAGTPLGFPARAQALPGQPGAWQQLSCVVTPSHLGILTARVISSDTSQIAVTTFDAFGVA